MNKFQLMLYNTPRRKKQRELYRYYRKVSKAQAIDNIKVAQDHWEIWSKTGQEEFLRESEVIWQQIWYEQSDTFKRFTWMKCGLPVFQGFVGALDELIKGDR